VQHDVVGLDVAMDHPVAMRVLERCRDGACERDGLVHREGPLPIDAVAQGLAFHERHHVVHHAVRHARIVQLHDVGVEQVGRDADLGEEPFVAEHGRDLGMEDLERHPLVMPEVLGQVHGRHASVAEFPVDAVAMGERCLQVLDTAGHWKPRWGWPRRRSAAARDARPTRDRGTG
jgi:hypothetical protein